jgi:hypothetical protein
MSKIKLTCILLVAFGAMWSLASSVLVYNAWRIAVNASKYKAAELTIQEVRYWKDRKGSSILGYGHVSGRREAIGLIDFGPFYTSQFELESAYPKGKLISIWYDPSAADISTQGRHLRVLPYSYPLDRAFEIAILTTIKHEALLIFGLCLMFATRKKGRVASILKNKKWNQVQEKNL